MGGGILAALAGQGWAVFEAVSHDVKGQYLNGSECFVARFGVGQHAGQGGDLGDLLAIDFLFNFNCVLGSDQIMIISRRRMLEDCHSWRYDPTMQSDSQQAVLEALSSKHNVLVVTHARPDGDALGTAAAMAMGLGRRGIAARVMLFAPLPAKYSFVFEEHGVDWFEIEKGWPANIDLHSFDALLVVDTGTWSQLPGLKEVLGNFKGQRIVVDHHLTQENWADVKFVQTTAAAAGEIAAELLERWGIKFDKAIATALFLAIATDTGWFQFANTSPKTMRLAATLMEAGVDTARIYQMNYQNDRPQRLAAMARALQSVELLADNRLAVMSLSKADFAACNAGSSDTENLVNIPLQVGTVEVSIMVTEHPEGGPIRANLRSKGQVDVAAFAQRFKGGGHARAAGLKIEGELLAVRRTISTAMVAEFGRASVPAS